VSLAQIHTPSCTVRYAPLGARIPSPGEGAEVLNDHAPSSQPLPPRYLDPVTDTYPGEQANKSWFATIKDWVVALFHTLPHISGLLDSSIIPLGVKVGVVLWRTMRREHSCCGWNRVLTPDTGLRGSQAGRL
jgi:hypothetical protein